MSEIKMDEPGQMQAQALYQTSTSGLVSRQDRLFFRDHNELEVRVSHLTNQADHPNTRGAIEFVLGQLGVRRPDWKTLLLSGAGESSASTDRLWAVLEDVERWPDWSPLHQQTAWLGSASLTMGARFEQRLNLGFPLGTSTEAVTITFSEREHLVGWTGSSGGIRSCHVWRLDAANHGTHVSNVEAFVGVPIALIKPLVANRWRAQFQQAADGLIAAAER